MSKNNVSRVTRRALVGAVLITAFVVSSTSAQQPQTQRVRGTIEKVEGNTLSVKARDGAVLTVALAGNATVIGVTGMPQADGSQKAVEIHIFPEPMRGTGEGHRPWDLAPNSTMTNATVAQMVKAVDGDVITLKYKDGEKKIVVTPQTEIVTYVPGSKDELKPGAKIFIAGAAKKEDGTLEAASISVGRDGVTPPM